VSTLTEDRSSFLEFSSPEFRDKFPDFSFTIQHHPSEPPEFHLRKLAEVVQQLPENLIEYYSGEVSIAQRAKGYPKNGLSVVETVRQIEECGSWMGLRNVETDPEYARLMREVSKQIYAGVGDAVKGMHREEAFIFVTSPDSVTPFHMDEEHNFLLQIRGQNK
jgi:hypothetical protein